MSAVRGVVAAAALLGAASPAADAPYRPAAAAERRATAAASVAAYRFGDVLWENDCTAHRIYGRALEAVEPPSGSGIDAWGKSVSWPYMDRQLRTGDQHVDHGEGLDFYNVGTGRGAGGLGIWLDNKLWTSRNYARVGIRKNGPAVADFEVDYDPWPVGVGMAVRETRRFTLPAGTPFTRMVSTIRSTSGHDVIVGIGISKRATDASIAGQFAGSALTGRFRWWGPDTAGHGAMAIGLLVDPRMVTGVTADNENHLVLLRVRPGTPFVYYAGAAWSGGRCARTPDAWKRAIDDAQPDFRIPRD